MMNVDSRPAATATADTQRWAAEQTLRMHNEAPSNDRVTGVCARCQPGAGCPFLAWALTYIDGTRTVTLYQ